MDAVYVASGTAYADALGAAPVAARRSAPLMLVGRDSVPAPVAAQLARLKPKKIHVVGGTATISTATEKALARYGTVVRSGGKDRFEVAVNVARTAPTATGGTVYLADGMNFPDALSAGPAAAKQGAALLVAQPKALPAATRAEIARLKPKKIVVLGGTASVSSTTLAAARAASPGSTAIRLGGADRYAVAANVAKHAWPNGSPKALIASGTVFWDALSAVPAARVNDAPLLLTNSRCRPAATVTANARYGTRLTAYIGSSTDATAMSCATAAPAPITPKPTKPPMPAYDKNCADFPSRAAAQAEFDLLYPYYGDVYDLDRDHDMKVCETMR